MQEKKNKRLLISLLLLTTATIIVAFVLNRSDDYTEIDKQIFKVDDLKSIDRVVLESPTGRVELSFNGSRWLVNNRYDADPNMVSVLFATFREAEPKRLVQKQALDSLTGVLKQNGVNVTLFSGQSKMKEFRAGGNKTKTQAWFMDPGDNRLYIMTIPGYRVYVSGILELNENQWRNKLVFSLNWRNFQGLKVEFPGKPAENFNVELKNKYFGIQGISQTDTTKLNTFLDRVSLLTVDDYTAVKFQDSLHATAPLMIITVKDIAKKEYSLKIFPGRDERIVGIISDSQAAYFNRQKIQPLLRPKSFFVMQ